MEIATVSLKGYSFTPIRPNKWALSQSILAWVGNTEFADLSIRLDDGSSFPAHKVILAARSDYFKALLTGGMRETGLSEVHISNLSKGVVEILMVYLYSGTMECDRDHIVPLFIAADRFCLKDLREFAVQEFKRSLTVILQSVQEIPLLFEDCKSFVLDHLEDVAVLREFDTLPNAVLFALIRHNLLV